MAFACALARAELAAMTLQTLPALVDDGAILEEGGETAMPTGPQLAVEAGQEALLSPGAGTLPAPNGANRDESDDELSAADAEEIVFRQAMLDLASSEFDLATATDVMNDVGEVLHSDGTWRPVVAPLPSAPRDMTPPEPSPECFDIATVPSEGVPELDSRDSTPKRRRSSTPDAAPAQVEEPVRPPTPPLPSDRSLPVMQTTLKKSMPPRSPRGTPKASPAIFG